MKRALVAIIFAVALFGGWWAYIRFRKSTGAHRIATTLHLNAKWWREHGKQEGDLLYVAIGDSAAQGVGASKPHRGYVGAIAKHIRNESGKSVRAVNLSVSGARLREALAVQLPQIVKLTPDIMTVAVGANDMADFDPKRFERELRTVLDSVPKHAIIGEVPCFFFGQPNKNARMANDIVHELADELGFRVAPVYESTRRQGVARTAFYHASPDYFHPNDRGHRVWADAFLPLVDKRLSSLLGPKHRQSTTGEATPVAEAVSDGGTA
ncbi:SGNH/GDSL hydrolase family protein [Cryobacterium sp. BB307]|uniref:GDSL-type esterase/lipase family protein n=1 Tax=Cryobacterium sp. BB307 TaxID=2716317 RepID=UPI0014478629